MNDSKPTVWMVALRGLVGRCPRCGSGKLFRKYLKQVDQCAVCGEPLGQLRADDGPAWLTILIVGHIVAFILLAVIPDSDWPDWLSMTVWPSLALLLALIILPRAKGLFIGIIWRMQCSGAQK